MFSNRKRTNVWIVLRVGEKTVERSVRSVFRLATTVQPLHDHREHDLVVLICGRHRHVDTASVIVERLFPDDFDLDREFVARADRHRKRGETFSAEFEYGNALNVDEENIRANFGLGLTYLERGDKAKANDIFERLVKLDAAFETEHKHLFNDFGINLRKQDMYDQAVDYYSRALELTEDDENLHYNIARAYFGIQNYEKALEHLNKALELAPEMKEAQKFITYLKNKRLV